MSRSVAPSSFQTRGEDAAGVLSWVHLGDLHIKEEGEDTHHTLRAIVTELNACFADSVSFAYLPGDIADDGSQGAYGVVRRTLDTLHLPWCAILGDHDVHEKSFRNVAEFLGGRSPHYAFTSGRIHFVALNAFDIPDPKSFAILPQQMAWCRQQLEQAVADDLLPVLLLHCYPSELKVGAEELKDLIDGFGVRLVDMGHTHYNEIANDGHTLYTATRSTGQREEGPAGFSVLNLDGDHWSWRFLELGSLPAVMITSPADYRLVPDTGTTQPEQMTIRAKVWAASEVLSVHATFARQQIELTQVRGSRVWQGHLNCNTLAPGVQPLTVHLRCADGKTAGDAIYLAVPPQPLPRRPRDRENALAAWPEHGLLGTQLGPNKHGRQW